MLKPMSYAYGDGSSHIAKTMPPSEAKAIVDSLPPIETGYDAEALASYKVFRALRDEGVIPKGVRFQVSIPTPLNPVALHLEAPFKPFMEPVYTSAVLRAVQNIQTSTPHHDLAIQFDCPTEFMLLEGVNFSVVDPWFPATVPEVAGRIVKMVDAVDADVEVGIHLCYGNSQNRHFVEPSDMGLMVDVAGAVIEGARRKVEWVHMPVPKSRVDDAYFEPLRQLIPVLEERGTQLVLGLVHAGDEDGTRERMSTAKKFVGDRFGIATECGMGRTARSDLDSILQLSARFADET